MSPSALVAFKAHAATVFPEEACGWLVAAGTEQVYVPSVNGAENPCEYFQTDARDYLKAIAIGRIVAICHSHPNGAAAPSDADRTAIEESGKPWYILAWPSAEIKCFDPCGYAAPLLGRQFMHSVHDCFALVRDYYQRQLGIVVPDFEREEDWWDKGFDLLTPQRFTDAGFVVLEQSAPQKLHDGIVMQLRGRERNYAVPNHCAVICDDDVMMHHLYGHLSNRTVWGGFWQKCTRYRVRHRQLM